LKDKPQIQKYMPQFPICESVEEALKKARASRRDDLGNLYHTFRIRLADANANWQTILSGLVDAGWQLQGTPVVIEATHPQPRHDLFSMLHVEPRPLRIHGEMRLRGEISGGGDFQGQFGS